MFYHQLKSNCRNYQIKKKTCNNEPERRRLAFREKTTKKQIRLNPCYVAYGQHTAFVLYKEEEGRPAASRFVVSYQIRSGRRGSTGSRCMFATCTIHPICRPALDTVLRRLLYIAFEGLVRIQYKSLVPIYVFTEMKLLFLKQNYDVLSPSSYTHISVRDLYISRIGLLILLQKICGLILGIYKSLAST